MRLLHLNSYDYRGGSETVFNLSRFNPNVKSNLSGYIKIDKKNNKLSDIGFKTWETDNKIFGPINYIFSIHNFRVLKNFLRETEINIVHLHNIFSALSPSVLAALKSLKELKNFKVIQTVHDYHMICPNANLFNYSKNMLCENCIGKKLKFDILFENCDRRGWTFSIIKGLRNIVSNNIIRYEEVIDLFISPSEFLKSKLIKDGVKKEKILVVRNPIVTENFNNAADKKNIICYFGRFSPEKNVGFLIDAFIKWQQLKENDFILKLIGEGEEEDLLKYKAINSKYRDKIIFKPFIPSEELKSEIRNAKYFSMSSKWFENSPMVIVEAVANGMIPIVPDLGGMKEIIYDVVKVGKVYKADSISAWIDTIYQLEQNYQKEVLLLNESLNLINKYNLENYLVKLNEIYQEIVSI